MIVYEKADMSSIGEIIGLVNKAVENLQAHGNMQWDERYPLECDFVPDIQSGTQYIGRIGGRAAVIYALNTEHDPQYDSVEWPHEGESWTVLHRFIVHPDFQGQGVAKEALTYIIGQLKDQGVRCIRLDTYQRNEASQHLYRSFGFVPVGIAWFRDKPFDLMELYIGG